MTIPFLFQSKTEEEYTTETYYNILYKKDAWKPYFFLYEYSDESWFWVND